MNELRPYDDMRNLVVRALKDSIAESVERGLGELGLCPDTCRRFAADTMRAAEESGALAAMFSSLVSDYVDGHMVTIEDLLRGKAE